MPTRFFSVVQKAAKALRASNALAVMGKRREPQLASGTFTKGKPKTSTSRGSRVFGAGEHRHRTPPQGSEATPSHPKATQKPPPCDPHSTPKPPPSHHQATNHHVFLLSRTCY